MSKAISIKHKSEFELVELARAQDTDADTLEILIETSNEAVMLAVAEHPNTKPETLAALVPTGLRSAFYLELATRLAQNARTPDYALQRLGLLVEMLVSRISELEVYNDIAVSICCNPNTPLETAMRLLSASYSNTEFRRMVAAGTTQIQLLHLLGTDRSKVVREQARQTLAHLPEH